MTYSPIGAGEIGHKKSVTVPLLRKLADNLGGALRGDSGAPYVETGWHPYDGANVGDGATGEIWSFAADGAMNVFETPTLNPAYEYRLRMQGISQSTATAQGLLLQLYYDVSAAYSSSANIGTIAAGAAVGDGFIEVHRPYALMLRHFVRAAYTDTTTTVTSPEAGFCFSGTIVHRVTKFRLYIASGNFDAGAAYLDKRLAY